MKKQIPPVTDKQLQRGSTLFLKASIVVVGLIVLAFCVFALPAAWRGVAKEYSTDLYAYYGILIAMWATAVPFYIALYQAFQLLRFVDQNQAFSEASIAALKVIKYCAVAVGVIYAASTPFFYVWAQRDDAPGLIIISMGMAAAPLVVAVFAAVLQRLLRQGLAMKSENDLTV